MNFRMFCKQCIYEDTSPAGIVCIKVVGSRIILARLSGCIDFLELETCHSSQHNDSPSPYQRCKLIKFSKLHRIFNWLRFNIIAGHNEDGNPFSSDYKRTATFTIDVENEIRCVWLTTQKAHSQPITCLECEGGRMITGSQDHTLKVTSKCSSNYR